MRNQIRLGRVFGIEIGLHVSWFIIAYLITLSVVDEFRARNPGWSSATVWLTALITAFLFFVTILVHELSHALVARSRGIPVRAITLFALGGVAQITQEPSDPSTEFWMALVGPLASILIGAACLGLALFLGWSGGTPSRPALALLVWLGYINIGLALFNLIPGYPLDGGRLLRAALWWITRNGALAARWSARTGHWVAMAFIFIGLFRFFNGAGFNGLWLAFIGWFLNDASHSVLTPHQD